MSAAANSTPKPFLGENFLLDNDTAADLYHGVAKAQPIVDYHTHLPPAQVADDHRFPDLAALWLEGDHYKWRAMRANGVAEKLITGKASPWEKFRAWAGTVPWTLRNPLYHWTHMELAMPFGVKDTLLGPGTAGKIWRHCNERLAEPAFSAQGLLRQFNVRVVCSTDDPTDDLEPHRRHAKNRKAFTRLYPTWRPDRALAVEDLAAWNAWVDRLEVTAGAPAGGYDAFLAALKKRHDFFHRAGCRSSDHGLDTLHAAPYTEREVAAIFKKARGARGAKDAAAAALDAAEIEKFRSAVLHDLAVLDAKRGWAQQFHLGALRGANTKALRTIGRDTGFDAMGDFRQIPPLRAFLDRLESEGALAKTILYNHNPADNEALATLIGSFQDGKTPGKMQYGSAWWFLDQKDGMERQISALSNMGLLSRFVGMLTDSRCFVSYSRHEYFRRLLCNLVGRDVEAGLLPNDRPLLERLVKDVCYRNARAYFEFK